MPCVFTWDFWLGSSTVGLCCDPQNRKAFFSSFNGISMGFPDSLGCLFHHRNGSAALDREKVLAWQIAAEVGARCSEYQK